ncbi:MAG: D-aminoacyl-tRNA deacylase [Patescibacteria group bacterium]|mgnify:CR=1 FL=1
MKVVVQRVKRCKIVRKKDNQVIGRVGCGLLLLLGIKKGDTKKQADSLLDKIIKLRIMADNDGKMNLSIQDTNLEILVVSQFTLLANTKDGNRPSFIDAEEPIKAKELYEYFVTKLKEKNVKVETGSFGDYMKIEAELDGPVTIIYETKS